MPSQHQQPKHDSPNAQNDARKDKDANKDALARAKQIVDSGDADRIAQARSGELGPEVQAEVERLHSEREGAAPRGAEAHKDAEDAGAPDEAGGDEDGADDDHDEEKDDEGEDAEGQAGGGEEGGAGAGGAGGGAGAGVGVAAEAKGVEGGGGSGGADGGGGGAGAGAGESGGALLGGQHPVGSSDVDGGGVGACGIEVVSEGVRPQLDIHHKWATTEPWAGAGDYAKYGEAFSTQRLQAVIGAVQEGRSKVADVAAQKLGAVLASGTMTIASKYFPFIGDLTSILGGFFDLATIDFAGTFEKLSSVVQLENWDDNPFGTAGDLIHAFGDGVKALASMVTMLGGLLGMISNVPILLPLKPVSLLLKGLSLVLSPIAAAAWERASSFHAFAAWTADADARGIDKTLQAVEDERVASGGEAFDLVTGLAGELSGADGLTSWSPDMDTIGERFHDPVAGDPASLMEHWVAAQKRIDDDRNDIGTWSGVTWVGAAALALPLGLVAVPLLGVQEIITLSQNDKAFSDLSMLPEPPLQPVDMCEKVAQKQKLEHDLQMVRDELPKIDANRAHASGVKARGEQLEDAGSKQEVHVVQVEEQLAMKEQAHGRLTSGIEANKSELGRAAAERDALKAMREIVAGVDNVPRALVPDRILKTVDTARPLLGMESPAEGAERAKAHFEQGRSRAEQAGNSIASGRQRATQAGQRSQEVKLQGESLHGKAEEFEAEFDKLSCDATTTQGQLETAIAQLDKEIRSDNDALNGWAVAHAVVVEDNSVTADAVLDGAEVDDGEIVSLTHAQTRAQAVATKDVQRVLDSLVQIGAQRLVNREGLQEWLVQYNIQSIIEEGKEDCAAALSELASMAPEDFAEVVGGAYDTVGRIRKRLEPIPNPPAECAEEPPKKDGEGEQCEGPDCDNPPPDSDNSDGHDDKPNPQPEPIDVPSPVTIHFKHDAPPAKAGGVFDGFGNAALSSLIDTLGRGKGGRLRAVGHASVEGSTAYNQGLSERRARYVQQSVEAKTSATVEASGVGEREAGKAKNGEDEAAYPEWRKVVVTVVEKPAPKAGARDAG